MLLRPGDLAWSATYSAVNLESVEVVILKGLLIDVPHEIWDDPEVPNEKGFTMSVPELDVHFHSVLLEVQRRFPNTSPDNVNIFYTYIVFRLLWRNATTEAQSVGIVLNAIESINRWRKNQRATGIQPGWTMMQHYTDANVALLLFTQFSRELPS